MYAGRQVARRALAKFLVAQPVPANGYRDQRRPDRHAERAVPQGSDTASRLHRILNRCRAVTEERGRRVDVRDGVRHPPERGRTLARRIRSTDYLDDHLAEPKEDLADRSSVEFTVAFPGGSTSTAASDSTVRPRSGDISTTWSMAMTPFRCVVDAAGASLDLVVGRHRGRGPTRPMAGRATTTRRSRCRDHVRPGGCRCRRSGGRHRSRR